MMAREDTQQRLKSVLSRARLRATSPRLFVLEQLHASRQPTSARGMVRSATAAMDRATVYRTLTSLKKKGIVRQVEFRHGHAHYEIRTPDDHHHIICVSCGISEDVPGCGAKDIQNTTLKRSRIFSVIREHSLEFYGVCRSCAEVKKNVRKNTGVYEPKKHS